MSLELMVRVFTKEVDHSEQAVLLAMADHADDDGSSCYPSVDRIAWKTGYKPRNVIRVMGGLRKKGALEIVAPATLRKPTEYHIHLDRLPDKQPFGEWRAIHGRHAGRGAENAPVQSDGGRGAKSGPNGMASGAPEPPGEPPYKPSFRKQPKKDSARAKRVADRLRQMRETFGDEDV